jgi:signal transduction histidine kinase
MTPAAQNVIDALGAFVLALDAEGKIVFWNRHLEEVTGYRREEMVGRPGEALVAGSGPHVLPVKGGAERLVRWQMSSPPADGDDRWSYAVGTDVTEAQDRMTLAMRADRLAAVETLAAGLAHEVRNPLNAALLQLTVLRRRLDRPDCVPSSVQPVAALVEQELQRLDHLVDDFIAFAQPRPLDLRPTDLVSLCRTVAASLTAEANAGQIQVRLDLPEDVPTLEADPERLQHVLLNLARNAIEAMPGGGTLALRARLGGRTVEIDVADTGPGFPEGAPVFDAFFTTKAKGTGLGLSIVHRIVTDHGGTVRVRSHPGDTCFTVALPVAAGG